MMLLITSSMFSHIGWEDDTLFVRYHPTKAQREAGELGTLWAYKNYVHGVPEKQPEEGWGKWFNANVKKLYTGEKVEEQPKETGIFRCLKCGHPDVIHGAPGLCPIVDDNLMVVGEEAR